MFDEVKLKTFHSNKETNIKKMNCEQMKREKTSQHDPKHEKRCSWQRSVYTATCSFFNYYVELLVHFWKRNALYGATLVRFLALIFYALINCEGNLPKKQFKEKANTEENLIAK